MPGALLIPTVDGDRALGLSLPENLSEEDWIGIGRHLARAERRLPWMIADWAAYGAGRWGGKYDRLVEATGFTYQALRDMAWVGQQFDLSRRRDKLSFSHHREVAALEPSDRDALLDRAAEEGWPRRQLRTEVARFKRAARMVAPTEVAPLTGQRSYAVVYADPAWKFEAGESERAASAHYPVMTETEIAALPVSEIAAADAVLYLWATAPCLEQALRVIMNWGFAYKTHIVWVKDRPGTGYRVISRHELLLIAARGALPAPPPGTQPDSVVEAPRGAHSAKPPVFRHLIERAYPGLARIELFARGALPPGWDGWGNQYAGSGGAGGQREGRRR